MVVEEKFIDVQILIKYEYLKQFDDKRFSNEVFLLVSWSASKSIPKSIVIK